MSEQVIVGFQGEHGAYSEEAIRQHFGNEVQTLPCHAFEDIFAAIEDGRATYGALPVENSVAGSINKAYDLLLDHDLKVWGEILLRVRHNLLAVPGTTLEDIAMVRSHPQALAQCERFLNRHGWQAVPWYDTAGSAKELAAEPAPGVAVIASRLAAEIYGLDILSPGIEDLQFNYTRFFIIGRGEPPHSERAKTSLVFAVTHSPGALVACLNEFASRWHQSHQAGKPPPPQSPLALRVLSGFRGALAGRAAARGDCRPPRSRRLCQTPWLLSRRSHPRTKWHGPGGNVANLKTVSSRPENR